MVNGLALVLIIFSVDAGVFFWVCLAYVVPVSYTHLTLPTNREV